MKTIIFDFDGTIADTFRLIITIFEDVVRSSVPVTQTELDKLRKIGLSPKWAQELGIPLWRAPFLMAKGRRMMRKRMQHIEVFPGLPDVLKRLHDDTDAVLIVMSSNTAPTINSFLRRKALDMYFTRVIGGAGLFKKARILARIVDRNKLDPSETIYVGDEVRDIIAAKKAGLTAVAVSWGFNDKSLLMKHEPDFIAHTPEELGVILGLDPTEDKRIDADAEQAKRSGKGGAHPA